MCREERGEGGRTEEVLEEKKEDENGRMEDRMRRRREGKGGTIRGIKAILLYM